MAVREGHPAAALDWLAAASRIAGPDAETAFLRARALRKLGRLDESRGFLIRARQLGYPIDPLEREQWLALAQAGQLREAEPHLAALLTDPGDDASEICEAYVTGYIRNHRIGEAYTLLDSWAADMPHDPLPSVLRGKLQIELGRWEDAEKSFEKALAARPGDSEAEYYLATVYLQRRRVREALSLYERCAAATSDPGERRRSEIGRVKCLRTLGEAEAGREILNRILAEEPRDRDALVELARFDLEAGRFADAVNGLEKADAAHSYDLEVRYAWAGALRGAGRTEEAREEFDRIGRAQSSLAKATSLLEQVQKNPADVESRFEAGRIFLEYGQPEKGILWLQSVLDYAPSHKPTCRLLADYYERRSHQDPRFEHLAHEFRSKAGPD